MAYPVGKWSPKIRTILWRGSLNEFVPMSLHLYGARYTQMVLESSDNCMRRSSPFWTLALLLAVLPTTGCLFRTRPVEETYSKAPLKESTQSALIDIINQQARKIQSLQA